ncbi:DUF2254 domain-containing protein [Niabella insulamsoli]|uniref:DUF2254 domain-containing protein n=1 Tax=Niabella insulamsoli TaxID=3144874 RepID=UPI0031FDDA15
MSTLKTVTFRIASFLKNIGNNIVFIPAMMGVGGVVLAVFMYYLESIGISEFLIDKVPFLVVNNYDTASTLLSTFSAGVLSILVFSFSMVMLLLNQAGSNFSPRVLPSLISVKSHQYIIGLFLGCILYCAVVLIGLKPTSNQYHLPGFSVLLGMLFTVVCLFSFIYFIDSISKSIQVQNILSNIFSHTRTRMEKKQEHDDKNVGDAHFNGQIREPHHSTKSGYLREINEGRLLNVAADHQAKIDVVVLKGSFVLQDQLLFLSDKKLEDDVLNHCQDCFIIDRRGENIKENYLLGFKQISEIGIRAMSPGINDPATAITTIDYLTELFSIQMHLRDGNQFLKDQDGNVWVSLQSANFKDLLYQVMTEYRQYCKADMSCMQKLVLMLQQLKKQPQASAAHQKAIDSELLMLLQDGEKALENLADLEVFKSLFPALPKK